MPRSYPIVSVSRRAALTNAGVLGLALASRGSMATGQEATPTATTFSRFDHPIIGTWQWTNFPDTSYQGFSFGTFTQGGGYVEDSDTLLKFLAIGVWRATGERTAEVVMNPGVAISLHAAFEPEYVIAETCLVTRDVQLLRVMIEIDATGNRMTGTGGWELPAGNNRIVVGMSYTGTGDQMTIASDVG